jgi:hypothetical protein
VFHVDQGIWAIYGPLDESAYARIVMGEVAVPEIH